ncbi:MAG: crosslink repair DNA glycosylase YcaQ family protein [Anaerolineales bacterium]
MSPITISKQTARRFVLGKQGLWPGRRWKGKRGTFEALRTCEAVQLDPLNVVGRSQDIVLHSRVLDYEPDYLQQALYKDRQFFDYGGWLAVYPMSELPYWRVHMERRRHQKRVEDFVLSNLELFEHVREALRERGPLGNRDFTGESLGSWNYRGRKETSLVLYDMWLYGELMMHHRNGFDRVYDFRENIAPKEYDYIANANEAEEFFVRKSIAFMGLKRESKMRSPELNNYMRRDYSPAEVRKIMEEQKASGMFTQIQVEGGRETYLVLTEDVPALESLEKEKIPKGWNPKETTTLEEVTFLSPLDIVSARGRAQKLFDFDYKWEVYVPAPKRRWGYYVLPILYGDDLVARLDPKLDRETMTLQIKGFWFEDDAPVKDVQFANAFARGLIRFAKLLNAKRIDIASLHPPRMRKLVQKVVSELMEVGG